VEKPVITVVGTMHMDFTVYVDRLPKPSETVLGHDFEMLPGGKGANQAVAISRLGGRCYMVSRVGDDYIGRLLLQNAVENGVDTTYVKRDPEVSSGVALIFVDSKGENMIAVALGVDERISPRDVEEAAPAISGSKVVVAQLEIPVETALKAVKMGRERGKITLLNPAPAKPLPADSYRYIDYLTPNMRELESLSGVQVRSPEDAEKAAERLRELGVGSVIVTMGAQGALIVDAEGGRRIPSFKVNVVDTVGAGDAFNGALALALALNAPVDEAVRFANAVAALKVTKKGAQQGLPRLPELESFLSERGERLAIVERLRRASAG